MNVTEDYPWLEDDLQVAAWTAAQDRRIGDYLNSLPFRLALRARVRQPLASDRTSYRSTRRGGSRYFALKREPPKQQPSSSRCPTPKHRARDSWSTPTSSTLQVTRRSACSCRPPDGGTTAMSLDEHGGEDGTICVFDVATGEVVDTPGPDANPAVLHLLCSLRLVDGVLGWRVAG